MKIQIEQTVPSSLELVGGIFVTLAIILLANSRSLLNYYGLQSSNQLIKSDTGKTVTHGLQTLDSFSATNGVVTFMIWAVVGIICFGIVEALGSAYQQMRLDRQVSSQSYIHPASFTQGSFWRGVALDTLTLLVGLVVLAVSCILFMILVLPVGLAYSRPCLFNATPLNLLYLVIGLLFVALGLLVIDSNIRFLYHRRRIVSLG